MKAAVIHQTGAAEDVLKVEELSTPEPAKNELLIAVKAAAVNPIDTYIRSGVIALPLEFPYIVGCDFAGEVVSVGADVKNFKQGDRVWGSNQSLAGRQGTFAEEIVVAEEWAYPVPNGQSFESAAAGALVGITAHLGLFLHSNLQPGETVFVNGGTGGVGSAVVQFAKATGAKVIATVGSGEKKAHCEKLGADLAINYKTEDVDAKIKEFVGEEGGIDVWFETLREQDPARTIGLLNKRGRYIVMAGRDSKPPFPIGPFYVKDLRLIGFAMFNASPEEQRDSAKELNDWFTAGKWAPQVGETFPLEKAAQAHQLQEQNTLQGKGSLSGKIIVTI
ncbi:Quinone oxidoreductase 1 [Polystyrenella longa]|uniref:Quinone oxidoreductase 1 n=1 Tax=Polystyrenella longa TaxID=2528007 RepID=A0A518CJ35_9PLAN|nr:NADPH:quinone reductase [Polystyrenella longa]QDU79242.1 Quinone oxidoreductase 1 [Polystyrenella longa]